MIGCNNARTQFTSNNYNLKHIQHKMKQKSSFETMIQTMHQTLLKHLAFVGIYYLLQDACLRGSRSQVSSTPI